MVGHFAVIAIIVSLIGSSLLLLEVLSHWLATCCKHYNRCPIGYSFFITIINITMLLE